MEEIAISHEQTKRTDPQPKPLYITLILDQSGHAILQGRGHPGLQPEPCDVAFGAPPDTVYIDTL